MTEDDLRAQLGAASQNNALCFLQYDGLKVIVVGLDSAKRTALLFNPLGPEEVPIDKLDIWF